MPRLRLQEPLRAPGTGMPGLPSRGACSFPQSPPLRIFRGRETGQTRRALAWTPGAASPRPWAPPLPAWVPPPALRRRGLRGLRGLRARTVPPPREGPTRGPAPRRRPAPPTGTVLLASTAPPTGARNSPGGPARTLPFRGVGLRAQTAPRPGAGGCRRTAPPLQRGTRLQISPRPPNPASSRTA